MRYEDYNRGTTMGKSYRYAGCRIWWAKASELWVAYAPNSMKVIATAKGIKPIRDILRDMKLNKKGPWKEVA